jgi:hypothetical protein
MMVAARARSIADGERGEMKKRLFTDSAVGPTESLLRRQLGNAMRFYSTVLATSGNYRKQWQFSRGNGWILKVDDMRKALYYLIAFDEGIEISLTVRESEREELLNSEALEGVREQLQSGTKYAEGYALRFEIEKDSDCRSVTRFLTELMKLRPPVLAKSGPSATVRPRKGAS